LPTLLLAPHLLGDTGLPARNVTTDPQTAEQTPQTDHQKEPAPEGLDQAGPSQERLEASWAISQYKDRILQLETEEGAYSPALSEHLLGLGESYSKLGNHEKALQAYQRALLINRSNQGLHDLGQKPVLERIIETQKALGGDEVLNNNYDYLLWLYRRNYDSDDPQLLAPLIRVASWKLEAFARVPSQENVDYLYEAEELFDQSLHIIEANPGMDERTAIDHLYDIAQQNFTAGFFVSSYQIGREALQKIIDLHDQNEALSNTSLAEAWALLGDWEMSFHKRGSATESYRKAYQILNEDGSSLQAISRLFGKPRSLNQLDVPTKPSPHEDIILSDREDASSEMNAGNKSDAVYIDQLINENTEFILAEFDVNSSGRVSDLEIIRANPENDVSFRRNARERILGVPFRPRLENGELVDTQDFVMLYRFR